MEYFIILPFIIEILISFCFVAFLIYWFGNVRKHHILVTLNCFLAWYFAVIIVIILPLDVSSTAYRQCLKNYMVSPTLNPTNTTTGANESEVLNASFIIPKVAEKYVLLTANKPCEVPWSYVSDYVLQRLWRVVYWSSQALTWIILPMMQSYSTAGDFTVAGKIKTALIENIIYYASYLVIFAIFFVYIALQPNIHVFSHLKVICITASNTWGLLLLVFLEGYGLVEVPRKYWKISKKEYRMSSLYFKASKLSAERYEAEEKVDDLIEEILHISDMIPSNHPRRPFVDLILEKIPYEKKITTTCRNACEETGFGVDCPSEKALAKLHKKMIRAAHMYRRTLCLWNMKIEQIFHWEDVAYNENNPDRIFRSSLRISHSYFYRAFCTPKMEWYWYCMIQNWSLHTVCVLFAIFSSFVVWSELTFFASSPTLSLFALIISSFGANYAYFAVEFTSMITIAYMCMCAYYSVFRLRILNLYYLAPHHQTNEYSLIFCGMLLCRLTPPLCFNFLGLIHLDSHVTKKSNIEETSYTKIMGHMDVIPFISDGFNIYFPIMMFFVCLATYFNVCKRILNFFGFEQFISENDITSDLVDEGRELVRREKNIRQRLQNRELRQQPSTRSTRSTSSRFNRRPVVGDLGVENSPDDNCHVELLKDIEPVDYTEERSHSPADFGHTFNQEESPREEGNSYLRSSWSHIGRPPPGIFDDV